MTTLATDSFTRANEDPIASPWGAVGGFSTMKIVSNALTRNAGDGNAAAAYDGSISWPDTQWSEVTIGSTGPTDGGPAICISGGSGTENLYQGTNASAGTVKLQKFVAGSFSEIGSGSGDFNSGDVIRIERPTASTVQLRINTTVVIGPVTDTSLTSGKPGVYTWSGSAIYDNWQGGDFAAAAGKKRPGIRTGGTLGNSTLRAA